MNQVQIPIEQNIIFNGIQVQCIRYDMDKCANCDLKGHDCIILSCHAKNRTDDIDVIFKKL